MHHNIRLKQWHILFMNELPLISIIIVSASSSRIDMLRILAESIKRQAYKKKEVILVKNGLKENFCVEQFFESIDYKEIKSEKNLGVAGGRNLGISLALGDYLVFIDDDAEFSQDDALSRIVALFRKYPEAGVLTFKLNNCSQNQNKRDVDHGGYPFRRGKRVDSDTECSYFFGGASAFRKEVFEKIGLLPDEYFFGCEELAFSFQMLENGMKIFFSPAVVINHYLCEDEKRTKNRAYYLIRNRINLAFKYLPLRYALCHSALWCGFAFVESIKNNSFKYFLKGLSEGISNIPSKLKERKKISPATIEKIKQLRGRIYY